MRKILLLPVACVFFALLLIHFSLSAPVPFRILFAGQKFSAAINLVNRANHTIPDSDPSDGAQSIAIKHWVILDPNGSVAVAGGVHRIGENMTPGDATGLPISFQVPRLSGNVTAGTNYTVSASLVEIPFLYNGTDWLEQDPVIVDNKILIFQIQNSPQALLQREPALASILVVLKGYLCSNYGLYC